MKVDVSSEKSLLAPGDQAVSFAELFFDLVFVFCVTQVVHLLHGTFDLVHAGRALLVFWLVWWAWTQFTWALNAADTTHSRVQIATLVATAFAFFMAVSIPKSFEESSWWFGGFYVAVRSVGLLIYLWVTWTHTGMRTAVKTFGAFSVAGLLAVWIGGVLGGPWQYACWGLAILLDVLAATIGGNNDGWNLHPSHFAERHGLFVIIALGETLIVAAGGASAESWDGRLMIVAILAVGMTTAFWWMYFYKFKDQLEHHLAMATGSQQSTMGRDMFSLFHYPMLCGLIVYAYAIGEAMLHPYEPLSSDARLALALGITLYSLSVVLAYWRATAIWKRLRILMTFVIAALCIMISDVQPAYTFSIVLAGLLVLCVLEWMEGPNLPTTH